MFRGIPVLLAFSFCFLSPAQILSIPDGTSFKEGIHVWINGKGPFVFGLDTGASTAFYIKPDLANQLELPVTSHTHLHTGGEMPGTAPEVDVLRIDTLSTAGHDFHHAIGVGYSRDTQGTLGIELFKDVLLTLDFPRDRLSISTDSLPAADGKTIFHYALDHTTPVVPIVLGGMHLDGHVDTGARQTGADVMVPLSLAPRLHVLGSMRAQGSVEDTLGRAFKRHTAILDGDLRIGSLVVHNPTLLISDQLPYVNLGGLCNRLLIRLDQRHQEIALKLEKMR